MLCAEGKKADDDDILNPDWIPWQNIRNDFNDDSRSVDESRSKSKKIDGHSHVEDADENVESNAETIFGDDDVDVRTAPESRNNQPLDYDDIEFNTAPTSHNNDPVELEFDENIIKEETIDITEISANIEREKLNLNRIRDEVLQYDKVSELQSVIDGLFKVIERLNAKLRQYQIDLEYFRDNNAKTLYYTGLPKFALLETFIFKLSPHINRKSSNILSASRIIILTLMKLRLGLQFTDLGYRFQVSKQTASRAFFSCINTLYFKMKGMVYRPSREEVMNTMPNCFKTNFGDEVAHIIDCVELYIEAPYHFDTRIQCWSEYKHHYTLKYLVSITPQGMFLVHIKRLRWPSERYASHNIVQFSGYIGAG
ncbi:hypothetical protein HA402_011982 [Bradysia odoriphaga]|nr:hypothetical protein HA402_011982 [Bradysia odoriphaga]